MTAVIDHLRGASPRYVWNSWFLSDMLDIAASSCYNGQLKHILACDPSDQVELSMLPYRLAAQRPRALNCLLTSSRQHPTF